MTLERENKILVVKDQISQERLKIAQDLEIHSERAKLEVDQEKIAIENTKFE